MAKFRGNNRAWFVVSFVLRHVGRDDLCSPWYLAVNCFLRKRFTGNSMKQHAESNKTTAHNKETNFNQYIYIYGNPLIMTLHLKSKQDSKTISSIGVPSDTKRLHTEPISTNQQVKGNLKCWRFHGGNPRFFWTHHTKDLCNVKAQFKPKMVGFQTILGLDVVEVWKSFCEVLFQWKRWYDRTRKWVVMGFVSVWTFEIL